MEPTTFNFTSSATTHNFTITALKDDVVEEDQSVVLSATTDAVNVAIQSNMPTVIVEDRTSEYMACTQLIDPISTQTTTHQLLSVGIILWAIFITCKDYVGSGLIQLPFYSSLIIH